MQTPRFVRLCFLSLGVVLFVQFALVWRFQLHVYALTSLAGSLTFLLFFFETGRRSEAADDSSETNWPTSLVVGLFVLTVAYAVWVVAQLLVRYSLL